MKAMLKSELAERAGVTRQTFRNWLQNDRKELAAMGVSRMTKVLPPQAVKYLSEKYDIEV